MTQANRTKRTTKLKSFWWLLNEKKHTNTPECIVHWKKLQPKFTSYKVSHAHTNNARIATATVQAREKETTKEKQINHTSKSIRCIESTRNFNRTANTPGNRYFLKSLDTRRNYFPVNKTHTFHFICTMIALKQHIRLHTRTHAHTHKSSAPKYSNISFLRQPKFKTKTRFGQAYQPTNKQIKKIRTGFANMVSR